MFLRCATLGRQTTPRLTVQRQVVRAHTKTPEERKFGTIIALDGEGADQWITIQEEKTKVPTHRAILTNKELYYWLIWPFPYNGTQ
jgi:hypothetical protein